MVDKRDETSPQARRERRKRYTPPSEEDFNRGRRFAAWMRAGMARAGFKQNKELVEATKRVDPKKKGISATYIGVLSKDGRDPQTGEPRRASEDYISILARAMGADEDAGREAAGWGRRCPLPPGQIVLESGETYTVVANPLGVVIELEITPDLLHELELHAELQKFRRENREVGEDMPLPDNGD